MRIYSHIAYNGVKKILGNMAILISAASVDVFLDFHRQTAGVVD
jgi:hypothetical protein